MIKKLKRFLYLFHRWLGIGLCLWFVLLFASGIVMMYVEYPELTEEERLWQMEALTPAAVQRSVVEAAAVTGHSRFSSIRLSTIGGRPAYQLTDLEGHTHVIHADDGSPLDEVSTEHALRSASRSGFATSAAAPQHLGLVNIDQWTLTSSLDAHRPLHHVALNDDQGTELYISSRTGQIVRDTHGNERFWNWLGSTIHWIYPWQFRQHAGLWVDVLTYLSLTGVILVVSGAIVGWWRLRIRQRYRGDRVTPYQGWQKWHHVLGLSCLAFLLTWTFSGLMSMYPWGILDNTTSMDEQTARYYGGPLDALESFPSLPLSLLASAPIKEVEWRRVGSTPYLVVSLSASDKQVVMAGKNHQSLLSHIDTAIPQLRPDATLLMQRRLDQYDSWYYSHHNRYRPLPALEVRFDDEERSWYYLDLTTGEVIQRLTSTDRWGRWVYNGLHSFDFSLLFQRRPLWDIVVILLCLCGLGFSATSVVIGWRRLRAR